MSSRSRMPFGKSGIFHRQEIDTSKPLPVGERTLMSSTKRTTTTETSDRDSFVQRNEEEMLDSEHHPANHTMAMDENHDAMDHHPDEQPDEEGFLEEEEEATEQEYVTMEDKNDDNRAEQLDHSAGMDDSTTAADKAKKQRYEQILQDAAQWVEEMEDVKWGLQVVSIHNNILMDHMAMQGLDG